MDFSPPWSHPDGVFDILPDQRDDTVTRM